MVKTAPRDVLDLFIIGGGINGCGIARDAAGRGLSVGLAEMNDIGGATSSASTKLLHGGLRYLEYLEIGLVQHALEERETLLKAMPHISWPMRFVLPYHSSMRFENSTPASRILNTVMPWMRGHRPAWLIRFGLFIYDHLGSRKILPGTQTLELTSMPEGIPLKPKFKKAYEYSDCWIEDARLVVLNARDAKRRGAEIYTRTQVVSASRVSDYWEVVLQNQITKKQQVVKARMLVNAAGPWIGDVIQTRLQLNLEENVRLVRGSHIVTQRLYDHNKCYFFQGTDGRIVFTIPYETDFTLIGTTDIEHSGIEERPSCTEEEAQYLIDFANNYFERPISKEEIVWTYSGVRLLHDDGAVPALAATRDYTMKVDIGGGAPILNIFGGKITTYRCLAEDAMDIIKEHLPGVPGKWTAGIPLPGGDFEVGQVDQLVTRLRERYTFLDARWALRLFRAYGTEAELVLGDANSKSDLGVEFGATLTEREVEWLVKREFAVTAEDIVWRRSKLGLRLSETEIRRLDEWMRESIKMRAA